MKTLNRTIAKSLLGLLLSTTTVCAIAQEEKASVNLSAGADFVSSYVWRGTHCAGASFQPSIGIEYAGLSLGAWGSTDFDNAVNEFDLTLGYGIGGFSVSVTDYFFPANGIGMTNSTNSNKYFTWDNKETGHQLEGTLAYDFSAINESFPLTISWSTMFYGDDRNDDGDMRYSSYFELGYPVTVKDVTFEFAAGFTPWESIYQESESFNMVNFSIKGSKDLKITPSFSLPLFAQVVLNPNTENVYFVAGVSF